MGIFNWFAKSAARKAFALCDSNGNGRLEIAEAALVCVVPYMRSHLNKHVEAGQLHPLELTHVLAQAHMHVEVAILKMYNIVNKRLPSWQDPPSGKQIKAAFTIFDTDGNNSLDVDEFYQFSREMVKTGPDTFFSRIGRSAVVETMVLPGLGYGIKRFAGSALGLSNVPYAVFAPALGIIAKSVKGILPW